jgi:hypothetical protein
MWKSAGRAPVFTSFTLAFALQLRKKRGITSVRVTKTLVKLRKTSIRVQYTYHQNPHIHTHTHPHIHTHPHTHTTTHTHRYTHTHTHTDKHTHTHTHRYTHTHPHTHTPTDTHTPTHPHIHTPTPTHTHTHTHTHIHTPTPTHTHTHTLQKLPRSYRIQVCKKVDNRHCQQPINNASNMTTDSVHAVRSRPMSVSAVCCRNMPEDKDVSGEMCVWRTAMIKQVQSFYLFCLSVGLQKCTQLDGKYEIDILNSLF